MAHFLDCTRLAVRLFGKFQDDFKRITGKNSKVGEEGYARKVVVEGKDYYIQATEKRKSNGYWDYRFTLFAPSGEVLAGAWRALGIPGCTRLQGSSFTDEGMRILRSALTQILNENVQKEVSIEHLSMWCVGGSGCLSPF